MSSSSIEALEAFSFLAIWGSVVAVYVALIVIAISTIKRASIRVVEKKGDPPACCQESKDSGGRDHWIRCPKFLTVSCANCGSVRYQARKESSS